MKIWDLLSRVEELGETNSRAFGIGGAERVKAWDLLSRAEALRVTQRALWHWWAEDGVDSGSRGQPARRICGNLRLT